MTDAQSLDPQADAQQELPFAMVYGQAVTQMPVDLYIPPDALEVFLEAFEGPLDLLLYLIRKQNINILDIPVAEITRQYMGYVELMKTVRLELAAEYLVMAAMLAEIKSRMLLPRSETAEEEEDDPRAELIRRLQEYERFKAAAEGIDGLSRVGRDVVVPRLDAPEARARKLLPDVALEELLMSMAEVLRRVLFLRGVLADADLDEAVKAATIGRYQNSGQICVAAKRIIVEESVLPAFTEKFVAAVKALKIGDPLNEENYIGPMARYDLRDELHEQVLKTVSEGATLLFGGEKAEGEGNYYAPTILSNVRPGMTSFKEELFGPVASIIVARDAEHAVELANDSEFGLAGSVWTADVAKARDIASRLETGGVFINGYTASDARVPIGGVKKSGFGRELSHFGIREFCNAQTVWLDRR